MRIVLWVRDRLGNDDELVVYTTPVLPHAYQRFDTGHVVCTYEAVASAVENERLRALLSTAQRSVERSRVETERLRKVEIDTGRRDVALTAEVERLRVLVSTHESREESSIADAGVFHAPAVGDERIRVLENDVKMLHALVSSAECREIELSRRRARDAKALDELRQTIERVWTAFTS